MLTSQSLVHIFFWHLVLSKVKFSIKSSAFHLIYYVFWAYLLVFQGLQISRNDLVQVEGGTSAIVLLKIIYLESVRKDIMACELLMDVPN